MARALLQRSWPVAVFRGLLRLGAILTLHFGRTAPYVLRPWYALSAFMRHRLARTKFATVRSEFLQRVFSLHRVTDGVFRPTYAGINWLTFLVGLRVLPTFVGDAIEGCYAYLSYPFGTIARVIIATFMIATIAVAIIWHKSRALRHLAEIVSGVGIFFIAWTFFLNYMAIGTYENVVVTQSYRNISEHNTFAIHGQIAKPSGDIEDVYLTLGPNVWFWDLYPEFIFGKIPASGRCTFYTYGITLRIPKRLRIFSAGSLYALNPWIVDIKDGHCTIPTNVPPPQ